MAQDPENILVLVLGDTLCFKQETLVLAQLDGIHGLSL